MKIDIDELGVKGHLESNEPLKLSDLITFLKEVEELYGDYYLCESDPEYGTDWIINSVSVGIVDHEIDSYGNVHYYGDFGYKDQNTLEQNNHKGLYLSLR